jgi:small neutral amino acid transporter SnatA (MarC family)
MKTDNNNDFFADTKEYTSKHKLAWLIWTIIIVIIIVCIFAFIGNMTLEELPMNTN